jgi:hypothetical protein
MCGGHPRGNPLVIKELPYGELLELEEGGGQKKFMRESSELKRP